MRLLKDNSFHVKILVVIAQVAHFSVKIRHFSAFRVPVVLKIGFGSTFGSIIWQISVLDGFGSKKNGSKPPVPRFRVESTKH